MPSGAGEAGSGAESPEPAEDLAGADTDSRHSGQPRFLQAQMTAWAPRAYGQKKQVSGLSCRGLQPMLGFVYSCDQRPTPQIPVLEVLLLSHFTEEETKAWRGQIGCLVTLAWAE